jgi:hypothetical protein
MPTTTWLIANAEIQRPLGFEQFATTTNIAGNDQVISTELGYRWNQADYFNGWYCIVRGSANDEVIRRVEDYSGETGTLIVTGANFSSESGSMTCEVSRFHPDDVKRAFNRARQDAYPQLGIVRIVDTLVSGFVQHTFTVPATIRKVIRVEMGGRHEAQDSSLNLFTNGGMETWSSTTSLDDWTLTGSGASVNQEVETTNPPNYGVLSGSNSARIVVPSTTETTLLQTVTPDQGTEGMEVNVTGWVYSNTASRVSVRIAGSDGTAHTGTGWERISNSANLSATQTNVAAGIVASSGAAIPVFVDELILTLGPSEPIDLPFEPILGWEFLPPSAGASNGGTIEMPFQLDAKQRIRIIGVDAISSVSADSDTFEVDRDLLDPLYNLTRAYLCEERARQSSEGRRIMWIQRKDEYMMAYANDLDNGKYLHMPRPRLAQPAATGASPLFRRRGRTTTLR